MSVGNPSDRRLTARARAPGKVLSPSAAHDINNPLDSLLNLLYLIEAEANPSEKGRHYLALAKEEVRRISQIAHETLDKNKVVAVQERKKVGELFAVALEFYRQRFDSSGITVQTRYSGNDNIPVYAEQLRRVFSNLLLNAVEAMPQGGEIQARVSVGHEWSRQERSGVRVTVADNGSGISSDVLPHLFEQPFTTKPAGHGMGLSLVKNIVQKHKGWLRVRSSTQPGRHGTVFNLFLPAG
jgi:two-component system, NtrC family, sensor kinase